jgi:hypothetical protein
MSEEKKPRVNNKLFSERLKGRDDEKTYDRRALDPEFMLEVFYEYIEDRKNRKYEQPIVIQKNGTVLKVPKEPPLLLTGFYVYWAEQFKKNPKRMQIKYIHQYFLKTGEGNYVDFEDTCKFIRDKIYEDKYTGAACDIYNTNIIKADRAMDFVEATKNDDTLNVVNKVIKIGDTEIKLG